MSDETIKRLGTQIDRALDIVLAMQPLVNRLMDRIAAVEERINKLEDDLGPQLIILTRLIKELTGRRDN